MDDLDERLAQLQQRWIALQDRGFNPGEKRLPHGVGGGQWTTGGAVLDKLKESTEDVADGAAHGPGEGWELNREKVPGADIPIRVYSKGTAQVRVGDPRVEHAQMQPLLKLADRLQKDNPLRSALTVHVITREKMDKFEPPHDGIHTRGFAFLGSSNMTIAGDAIRAGVVDEGNWHAPVAKHVSLGEYVMVHEYGHLLDDRLPAVRKLDAQEASAKTSTYGATSEVERYAESFAEWYLTEGKTALLQPRRDATNHWWKVTPA